VYQEAVSACAVETNGATIDIIIKAVINIAVTIFFIVLTFSILLRLDT
jgi:hypothetical protein